MEDWRGVRLMLRGREVLVGSGQAVKGEEGGEAWSNYSVRQECMTTQGVARDIKATTGSRFEAELTKAKLN